MTELLLLYPGRLYRFVWGAGVVVVFYFCTKSAGEQRRVFDVPCFCNIGCVDVRAKPSSLPFPRVTAAGCCQGCAERRGVGLITQWHWMEPIGLAIRAPDWTNGIRKWGSLLIFCIFFRMEATELGDWGSVLPFWPFRFAAWVNISTDQRFYMCLWTSNIGSSASSVVLLLLLSKFFNLSLHWPWF